MSDLFSQPVPPGAHATALSAQPPLPPLPPIPAKRYFTIGEVSELCGVKAHVLRYWEQEFTQLKPLKRRGNRRYYQHHEVLLVRRIRELLYDQGYTIHGARIQLSHPNGNGANSHGVLNGNSHAVAAPEASVQNQAAGLPSDLRSTLESVIELLKR
jgi:DNA-binding transcriptional MerR regulator